MAQMNLRGAQLDIQDVATEIANDSTAIGTIATGVTSDPGATATFDADYVNKGGSTMTGLLVLSGDPVAALGAATMQYVDNSTWVEADITDLQAYLLPTDSIDALSDVDTTSAAPSPADVLSWNGSNWVPTAAGAPGAHASTHEAASAGGTDVIDGDVLEISFPASLPGGYVPDVAPPEVSSADQLTAHLAGIQGALIALDTHATTTTGNPHSVTKAEVGLGEVEDLKVNLVATAAPSAATDDVTLGYSVGSRWFDVTADKEYVCLDATDGAAVWKETTLTGGAATWGSITGTLSSQTDLQSALDGKAASVHTHVEADITDLQAYLLNITGEALGSLSDVTETSVANDEVLQYTGAGWENQTLAEAGISAVGHNHNGTHVQVAGDTMTGFLTLSADPTNTNHAATKQYVDNVAAGLDYKESVHMCTVSNLAGTYANGTAGLGATLTATVNGVLPPAVTDSHAHFFVGTRVLVKAQSSGIENGIYTITNIGSGEEVSEIVCGPDIGDSLDGTYWTFNDGATAYYVWYDTPAGSGDPTPGGTGIQVIISTNDTAETVKNATIASINGSGAAVVAYDDEVDTFFLVNDNTGAVTNSADFNTGFTVTTTVDGTGSPTAWVLTRATDADNSPSAEVSGGMFTFVEDGVSCGGTSWVMTSPVGTAVLGTDPLVFVQFSSGVGAVTSVYGRLGAVVAVAGDYNGTQVSYTPTGNIASTTVEAAINELDTEKLALAGDTMTGTLAMNSNKITNAELDVYSEEHNDAGNATGTLTVDLNNGNDQRLTVTGVVTIDFSNPAASDKVSTLVLEIINGGSAAVTWDSSIKWPGGTAPTLTASGTDIIAFRTRDNGTTWYGMVGGLAFA